MAEFPDDKTKQLISTKDNSKSKVSKRKPYKKRVKTIEKERIHGILIVEDEKSWSSIYKINLVGKLQKKRNFHIYEAKSSKEAVKILVQFHDRIDVILLDLVFGSHNQEKPEGLVLLETIVDRLGLTNLGIFVMTAYATELVKEQCYIRGVRYFADKSQLNFDRLVSLIEDYIELTYKVKGKDVGFYIELRSQKEQRYLYLRWKYGDKDWDIEYLGNALEFERIALPNVITDLNSLNGWEPIDDGE